jgi:hypothetical protein
MPEDDSAVTEKGVWYIGNIAQAPVICRPGAIGLVPLQRFRRRTHRGHAELRLAGVHQRHVLHRAAGDFAAAGKAEFFCNKVGPARAVGEIGAALGRGAHGEAFGPAFAVLCEGRGRDQRGRGRQCGDLGQCHQVSLPWLVHRHRSLKEGPGDAGGRADSPRLLPPADAAFARTRLPLGAPSLSVAGRDRRKGTGHATGEWLVCANGRGFSLWMGGTLPKSVE